MPIMVPKLLIRRSARFMIAAAVGGLVATSGMAQTVPDPVGPQTVIPSVPTLAVRDPNVRRATAVVNGDIITGTDVDQRVALVVAANDGQVPADELERLRQQVLRNLIDETLQIQAAVADEIEIENAEIDQTYSRVATQNFNQEPAALDRYLVRIGSSPASLKRQIRGEVAWQRLLRRNIQPFINVSEEEVREALARLQAAKGTDEYRVGEIFLSATPETRTAVSENTRRIVEQIRGGGSFVAYARQFSEASTAAVGGELGWVRLGQLPAEMDTALRQMNPGQLVGPVEIRGGFVIVYLIDKRQVLTADPRDAVLSLKQISINFPAGTTEAQAGARASAFADAVGRMQGCGTAADIAASVGAEVVDNDQIAARELPAQLQDVILSLAVGEATPPFGSLEDGVRVLMLCGRDDPQVAGGPSFDEMMSQMEDDRINKRAQLYLRDLRRDAVIDYN